MFETIEVDINQQTFQDVYQTICDNRDMSELSLSSMWHSKFLNEPLKDGQQVTAQTQIVILDVLYVEDSNYEVFDSSKSECTINPDLPSIRDELKSRGILDVV